MKEHAAIGLDGQLAVAVGCTSPWPDAKIGESVGPTMRKPASAGPPARLRRLRSSPGRERHSIDRRPTATTDPLFEAIPRPQTRRGLGDGVVGRGDRSMNERRSWTRSSGRASHPCARQGRTEALEAELHGHRFTGLRPQRRRSRPCRRPDCPLVRKRSTLRLRNRRDTRSATLRLRRPDRHRPLRSGRSAPAGQAAAREVA